MNDLAGRGHIRRPSPTRGIALVLALAIVFGVVAALLAGGGFWLFRRSWPVVAGAWSDALAVARHGSVAA